MLSLLIVWFLVNNGCLPSVWWYLYSGRLWYSHAPYLDAIKVKCWVDWKFWEEDVGKKFNLRDTPPWWLILITIAQLFPIIIFEVSYRRCILVLGYPEHFFFGHKSSISDSCHLCQDFKWDHLTRSFIIFAGVTVSVLYQGCNIACHGSSGYCVLKENSSHHGYRSVEIRIRATRGRFFLRRWDIRCASNTNLTTLRRMCTSVC